MQSTLYTVDGNVPSLVIQFAHEIVKVRLYASIMSYIITLIFSNKKACEEMVFACKKTIPVQRSLTVQSLVQSSAYQL